jgi:hypothetical protein
VAAGGVALVIATYASDHSVQRASRAHVARVPLVVEENEASRPVQVRFLGANAVMLHPDHSPHSIEELFSHDENLNGNNVIRPDQSSRRNRKMACGSVRKTEVKTRKMPYILISKNGAPGENRGLGTRG